MRTMIGSNRGGNKHSRWVLALPAAAASLLLAPAALASPPCECLDQPAFAPPDAATNVPTNARFFVSWSGIDTASLELSQGGTAVDFDVMKAGEDQLWIAPKTDLLPNTAVTLNGSADGTPVSLSWTTGAGPDDKSPQLESASIIGQPLAGACEEHVAANVELTGLADDVATTDAMLVRIDFEGGALDPIWLHTGQELYFGHFTSSDWQSCLDNASEAEADAPYSATVTAIDWAGNESATSKSSDFEFVKASAGGCFCSWGATDAAPAYGGAAGLAFAVATLLRRARRRTSV